jgi:hypothetical protein
MMEMEKVMPEGVYLNGRCVRAVAVRSWTGVGTEQPRLAESEPQENTRAPLPRLSRSGSQGRTGGLGRGQPGR